MNTRALLKTAVGALLALFAAACHDDDAAPRPTTLKQFAVGDIEARTSDTAVPVEINDLVIDAASEDPADYDDLLQSI